ncbi:MAG: asparagine synthase C-terminal domain-containing protein, partial [Thioalkalivibrio sp.]|nr:asparagine synthase C-terminal domain-containing protein [Thioalkalivibrio sp.]
HGDRGRGLWSRQVLDFTSLSLPTLLRFEDRNSMAHSVESRLPFMDHRFVEYAISLPTRLKIRDGYGKWLMRSAMTDALPNDIVWARYKRGFDVTKDWLTAPFLERVRTYVSDHADAIRDFLPTGSLDADLPSLRFGDLSALAWVARVRNGD